MTDAGDLYENLDPSVKGGGTCGDSDIVTWETESIAPTGSTPGYYLFRFVTRSDWNSGSDCAGVSLGVYMELDMTCPHKLYHFLS